MMKKLMTGTVCGLIVATATFAENAAEIGFGDRRGQTLRNARKHGG